MLFSLVIAISDADYPGMCGRYELAGVVHAHYSQSLLVAFCAYAKTSWDQSGDCEQGYMYMQFTKATTEFTLTNVHRLFPWSGVICASLIRDIEQASAQNLHMDTI